MAAIGTTDVTYTLVRTWLSLKERQAIVDVTYGDGVKTYPTGGVPLLKNSLGMKRNVDAIIVAGAPTNAYTYKADATNLKIISETAAAEASNAATPAATTLRLHVMGW